MLDVRVLTTLPLRRSDVVESDMRHSVSRIRLSGNSRVASVWATFLCAGSSRIRHTLHPRGFHCLAPQAQLALGFGDLRSTSISRFSSSRRWTHVNRRASPPPPRKVGRTNSSTLRSRSGECKERRTSVSSVHTPPLSLSSEAHSIARIRASSGSIAALNASKISDSVNLSVINQIVFRQVSQS
jgi:hypothetical protein